MLGPVTVVSSELYGPKEQLCVVAEEFLDQLLITNFHHKHLD